MNDKLDTACFTSNFVQFPSSVMICLQNVLEPGALLQKLKDFTNLFFSFSLYFFNSIQFIKKKSGPKWIFHGNLMDQMAFN